MFHLCSRCLPQQFSAICPTKGSGERGGTRAADIYSFTGSTSARCIPKTALSLTGRLQARQAYRERHCIGKYTGQVCAPHRWAIAAQYIEQCRIVLYIFQASAPTIQRDCPSVALHDGGHCKLSLLHFIMTCYHQITTLVDSRSCRQLLFHISLEECGRKCCDMDVCAASRNNNYLRGVQKLIIGDDNRTSSFWGGKKGQPRVSTRR